MVTLIIYYSYIIFCDQVIQNWAYRDFGDPFSQQDLAFAAGTVTSGSIKVDELPSSAW